MGTERAHHQARVHRCLQPPTSPRYHRADQERTETRLRDLVPCLAAAEANRDRIGEATRVPPDRTASVAGTMVQDRVLQDSGTEDGATVVEELRAVVATTVTDGSLVTAFRFGFHSKLCRM